MQLKDYIKILKKNIIIVVLIPLVSAAIAYALAAKMPSGYSTSQSFVIVPKDTKDDTFRGFYQQEKSRNFTDTAVAILENQNPGIIQVQKLAPQIIRLTASGQDQAQTGMNLVHGTAKLNETLQNISPENPLEIKPITEASQAQKVIFNKKIITVFGTVAGLALALVVVGIKFYLKL